MTRNFDMQITMGCGCGASEPRTVRLGEEFVSVPPWCTKCESTRILDITAIPLTDPEPKFKEGDLVCRVDEPTTLCIVRMADGPQVEWLGEAGPYCGAATQKWRKATSADVGNYIQNCPAYARSAILRLARLLGKQQRECDD